MMPRRWESPLLPRERPPMEALPGPHQLRGRYATRSVRRDEMGSGEDMTVAHHARKPDRDPVEGAQTPGQIGYHLHQVVRWHRVGGRHPYSLGQFATFGVEDGCLDSGTTDVDRQGAHRVAHRRILTHQPAGRPP